jgi:hypothetical protein
MYSIVSTTYDSTINYHDDLNEISHKCCLPYNFKLNLLKDSIKSATKNNFQSHSIFNIVFEGSSHSQKFQFGL